MGSEVRRLLVAGALSLAVMLLAVLGTAQAAEPALDAEENTLWTLINDYRQANGVQRVGLNDNLMAAAEWMSGDLATRKDGKFSHTDSKGRGPKQRMADFGYINTQTGENLVAGVDTAQEAFDLWKGSPGHNAIMLNPYFWAVGIARVYDPDSAYGWYWTMDFGGRGPAWFPPTPSPIPAATPTPTPTLALVSVPLAIPSPTPTLAPPPPVEELPATGAAPGAAFLEGYRDGGGDPAWEQHWIDDVIPCESEWVLDPPGIHYGLAQFEEGTWGQARCSPEADYRDPFEQGCAVARWMSMIPGRWGTTAGWPHCWWR